MMKLVFDAHLDLAMNAMEWNRNLRLPVHSIRTMEKGMRDKPDRSHGTVAFPEMHRGHIGLCIATLIARYVKPGIPQNRPGHILRRSSHGTKPWRKQVNSFRFTI
jgi:hypothetical protein